MNTELQEKYVGYWSTVSSYGTITGNNKSAMIRSLRKIVAGNVTSDTDRWKISIHFENNGYPLYERSGCGR